MCGSKCAKASVHRWVGDRVPDVTSFLHFLLLNNLFTPTHRLLNVRDQECRVFKERGRKVDCSKWDFEEPQVSWVFKLSLTNSNEGNLNGCFVRKEPKLLNDPKHTYLQDI